MPRCRRRPAPGSPGAPHCPRLHCLMIVSGRTARWKQTPTTYTHQQELDLLTMFPSIPDTRHHPPTMTFSSRKLSGSSGTKIGAISPQKNEMYKFGVGKWTLYENNLDRIVNVEPEEAGSPALKEDAKNPQQLTWSNYQHEISWPWNFGGNSFAVKCILNLLWLINRMQFYD